MLLVARSDYPRSVNSASLKKENDRASGAGREGSQGRLLCGFLQRRGPRPPPRRAAAGVWALLAVKNHTKVDFGTPPSGPQKLYSPSSEWDRGFSIMLLLVH